jgi:Protein of unknown function (DUF3352)
MLHMKKWLIPAAVLVLGSGVYLAINWTKFFGALYPETIFPADTTFYLAIHDIQDAKHNLNKTIFWQKTKESPRKAIYQKQGDRLLSLFESGTGINPKPLLEQFSKDIAFGIFSDGEERSGGALVGYIDNEEKTKEFFTTGVAASLKRRFPDSRRSQEIYNGTVYFKFTSSNFPRNASPVYCFLDHRILLSGSEQSLKRLLDVRSKKLTSLKENPSFAKTKKEIEYKRGILFFLNVQSLLRIVRHSGSQAMESVWPDLVKLSGASGVESLGYKLSVEKDGFAEMGFVFAKSEKEGLLKTYMNQPARELQSIPSIPASSQFLTAGTLADFGKMWSEVNAQLPAILNADQLDKWNKIQQFMKAVLNFDVQKDLLIPLGNEFSFSYIASPERAMNPGKMKYYLAVELKDAGKFRELIDRIETLQWIRNLERKSETYDGKKLESFRIKEGALDISPSFYFNGNWFYFASGSDFMKESIDAQSKGNGIQSDPDFKKVTAGFPQKVNGLSYTNVPAYLRMYSEILKKGDSGESWLHGYGLEEEMKYLSPYLFGAATYTVIRDEGIYFRSYASIPSTVLSFFPMLNSLPKYVDSISRQSVGR